MTVKGVINAFSSACHIVMHLSSNVIPFLRDIIPCGHVHLYGHTICTGLTNTHDVDTCIWACVYVGPIPISMLHVSIIIISLRNRCECNFLQFITIRHVHIKSHKQIQQYCIRSYGRIRTHRYVHIREWTQTYAQCIHACMHAGIQ